MQRGRAFPKGEVRPMSLPAERVPSTPGQRQTKAARDAFASRFSSPEERSRFYREIGRRGNDARLVLSGDEAAVLAEAYALLSRIAGRLPHPHDSNEP